MRVDGMMIHRDPIVCGNGLQLSVQASRGHDCLPQNQEGPYTHVEVQITPPEFTDDSERAFSLAWVCRLAEGEYPATTKLLKWLGGGSCSVAYCVPAVSVLEVIRENGGAEKGELPAIDFSPDASKLWGMNEADPDGIGRGMGG